MSASALPRLFQIDVPLDADNEDDLGLGRDVVRAGLLGLTSKADLLTLLVAVLLDVGLGTLEDDLALLLVGLIQNCQQRDASTKTNISDNEPDRHFSPERWLTIRQHRLVV